MLTERDLKEIIDLRLQHPVLSVYLNTDPASGSAEAHRLRLRQMLKTFEGETPGDTEAIERFIQHEHDWAGKSLVIFSNVEDGFFQTLSLSLTLRNRARRLKRPYVKPLINLLDSYGNYGVVLMDKQSARLFHFHIGDLNEVEGTMGETVRHTKRGGGSQSAGRRGGIAGQTRYAEEVTERNLREAVRCASRFFQDKQVRRILIGGTDANVARFSELLPKSWKCLVMDTFPIEMTAGHSQVLEKVLASASKSEQARESRLVDAVITAAAKGRGGVIRLDDTLGAVQAGNVQTLVISDGYRAPGFACLGCGYLTAQELKSCHFCASQVERIEDAVELAVRQVLVDGGEIEVLHNNRALETAGNICALLRY